MTINLKYVAYVVLAAVAIFCGRGFYSLYKGTSYSDKKGRQFDEISATGQEGRPAATGVQSGKSPIVSNQLPVVTNIGGSVTNGDSVVTNAVSQTTNSFAITTNGPVVAGTNLTTQSTNITVSTTNQTPIPVIEPLSQTSTGTVVSAQSGPKKRAGSGLIISYLGGFLVSIIILGLMLARDFSSLMGDEALELLFNDDGKGIKNPEYETAEQTWVNGDYLEAIRLMRDYYQRNPREVFVALRIAEIYEKDLGNFLAAALEYEEILEKKLPPERWGWAAIHLCNLYYKLQQESKATVLLNRIVKEYGRTPAAKKARKRLGIPEPAEDASEAEDNAGESIEGDSGTAAEEPKSNLPPGFRPKKQ